MNHMTCDTYSNIHTHIHIHTLSHETIKDKSPPNEEYSPTKDFRMLDFHGRVGAVLGKKLDFNCDLTKEYKETHTHK